MLASPSPRRIALLVALVAVVGCGGSDGDSDDGRNRPIEARFQPARPNPSAGDVVAAQGDLAGDLVDVRVTVTGVTGIFSADFRVFWNHERAEWLGWAEGTLLSKDGEATTFSVTETAPGQLRVQATRAGTTDPVDAVGTELLLELEFRLLKRGEAPFNFPTPTASQPRALRDPSLIDIGGLSWWGGQLIGG